MAPARAEQTLQGLRTLFDRAGLEARVRERPGSGPAAKPERGARSFGVRPRSSRRARNRQSFRIPTRAVVRGIRRLAGNVLPLRRSLLRSPRLSGSESSIFLLSHFVSSYLE